MPTPTDESFSRIAQKMRFLTPAQVDQLRARRQEVERAGARLSMFEIAQTDLMLTAEQLKKVSLACEYTALLDEERRIGEVAISEGLANEDEIAMCIDTQKYEFASQRRMPRRLTEILIEAEILNEESLKKLEAANAAARTARPGVREGMRPGSSGRIPQLTPAQAADPTIPYDEARLKAIEEEAAAHEETLEPPPEAGAENPPGKLMNDGVTRRITARVILEAGNAAQKVFPLTGKGRIGRQIGCMVRIDDSRASREHAQIDYDAQLKHHILSDLGSRNGVYLNDEKIAEPSILNPGDRIKIGDTVLRYEA